MPTSALVRSADNLPAVPRSGAQCAPRSPTRSAGNLPAVPRSRAQCAPRSPACSAGNLPAVPRSGAQCAPRSCPGKLRSMQPGRRGLFRRAERGRSPGRGRSRKGSGQEGHPLRSRGRFPERPGPPADPSRNSHSPFLLSTKNNWEEPKWSRKTSTWASISTPNCTIS